MTYQDTLDRVSAETEEEVDRILDRFEAGAITEAAAVALIARIIWIGQSKGAAIADLSLAAELSVRSRVPVPPAGVRNKNTLAQVEKAVRTTFTTAEGGESFRMRVRRLAGNEPQYVAKQAHSEALARSPRVEGWVRGLDADPCELCIWWSRDGRVWPKGYPLQHHKGCQCTQVPVLRDKVASVPYSRIQSRANFNPEGRNTDV